MAKVMAIEAMVREVRAAYDNGPEAGARAICWYFADQVESAHTPPVPMDGVYDAEVLTTMKAAEMQAIRNGMPDFREDVDITMDGDEFTIVSKLSGHLRDGTPLEATVPAVYEVEGGRIVKVRPSVDPDTIAVFMRVYAEGGWEIPTHDA
jgi:ketosteroid isomerase-like protein